VFFIFLMKTGSKRRVSTKAVRAAEKVLKLMYLKMLKAKNLSLKGKSS